MALAPDRTCPARSRANCRSRCSSPSRARVPVAARLAPVMNCGVGDTGRKRAARSLMRWLASRPVWLPPYCLLLRSHRQGGASDHYSNRYERKMTMRKTLIAVTIAVVGAGASNAFAQPTLDFSPNRAWRNAPRTPLPSRRRKMRPGSGPKLRPGRGRKLRPRRTSRPCPTRSRIRNRQLASRR